MDILDNSTNNDSDPVRQINIYDPNLPPQRRQIFREGSDRLHIGRNRIQRKRLYFILKVYFLATFFIMLTLLQWLILLLQDVIAYFKDNHLLSFLSSLVAFMLLTIFVFFDELRYTPTFEFFFGVLIVEFTTFGHLMILLKTSASQVLTCFSYATATIVVFTLLGNLIRRDLTRDIAVIVIFSVVCFFLISIFLIAAIITDRYILTSALILVIMVLVILYIMYGAQLISQNRYYMLRRSDYMLAAFKIYFSALVMFTLILFLSNTSIWCHECSWYA